MRLRTCGPVLPKSLLVRKLGLPIALSRLIVLPSACRSVAVRCQFGCQSWSRHPIPDKALAAVPHRFLLGKLAEMTRDRGPMVRLPACSRAEVTLLKALEIRSRNVAADILRALLLDEGE